LAISATSCGQGAGALDAGAEQLNLHAEFADALHGRREFRAGGVGLALLERAVEGGLGLLAPLLALGDGNAELTGEEFHALAAQQAQDDLALARDAPPLPWRQRADFRRRHGGWR
jgi:hypothetical protein